MSNNHWHTNSRARAFTSRQDTLFPNGHLSRRILCQASKIIDSLYAANKHARTFSFQIHGLLACSSLMRERVMPRILFLTSTTSRRPHEEHCIATRHTAPHHVPPHRIASHFQSPKSLEWHPSRLRNNFLPPICRPLLPGANKIWHRLAEIWTNSLVLIK